MLPYTYILAPTMWHHWKIIPTIICKKTNTYLHKDSTYSIIWRSIICSLLSHEQQSKMSRWPPKLPNTYENMELNTWSS